MPLRQRRRWVIATIGAVAVAVLCLGLWAYLHPGTSPVRVRDAIDRFRKDGGSTSDAGAEGARPLPATGVYVYTTKGYEHLDALGGARHDYPERTTITVRRDGCGTRERWNGLNQRWQEYLRCWSGGGEHVVEDTSHHEFFHQEATRKFTCDADAWLLPPHPATGETWTTHCRTADGIVSERRGSVVGRPTLAVGNDDVGTVHVRYEDTITGDSEGTATTDWWVARDTGLTVRLVQRVDTRNASPIGRVGFHDELRLDLTSTTPRR
jgi:hypothetical protein